MEAHANAMPMRLFPLLLFSAPLFAAQTNPAPEASISGTVTDRMTGEPLTKVQVFAEP